MKFNFEINKKKLQTVPVETVSIEKEETLDFFPESFETEVVPIIEIIKPDGVSLESYKTEIKEDLFKSVNKRQLAKGSLVNNPEETVKGARDILISRLKGLLEDSHRHDRKSKLDEDMVKKAKIALLFVGDISDAENSSSYFKDGNIPKIDDLRNYLVSHTKRGRGSKLSKSDIEAILKTKYSQSLASVKNSHYSYLGEYGCLETIPNSLMIKLVQAEEEDPSSNHFYPIKNGLEEAQKGEYDNKTLEQLLASGYAKACLEHVDKFEGQVVEKIIKSGLYSPNEVVNYLLSSNDIEQEDMARYLDIMVKHTSCYDIYNKQGKYNLKKGGYISIFEDEIEKLRNIEVSRLEHDQKEYFEIKKLVEDGYLGLVMGTHKGRDYLMDYARREYDNFIINISVYEQEHLVDEYLKEEDRIKYAKKLIQNGEEYLLVKNKKMFRPHSLGLEEFTKINDKELTPSLKGDLSIFKDLTEKEADELIARDRFEIFVYDIKSFSVSNDYLQTKKVQEAALLEFEEEVNDVYPNKARMISERMPLPQDKIDKLILSAIEKKWENNNSSVRAIISEFPEIKKYLEEPKYQEKATRDLTESLEKGWIDDVEAILRNFPLNKEMLESEEIRSKCLEMMEKHKPNSLDVGTSTIKYLKNLNSISTYIKLPEYLLKQKEIVMAINEHQDENVKLVRQEIILKIFKSDEPELEYQKILSSIEEVKENKVICSYSLYLDKYIDKFKDGDNEGEKEKFISLINKINKYDLNLSLVLKSDFDLYYERLLDASEEDIICLKNVVDLKNQGVSLIADVPLIKLYEQYLSYSLEERRQFEELVKRRQLYKGSFEADNYSEAVLSYVASTEDLDLYYRNEEAKKEVLDAFSGKYKDIALKEFSSEWQGYLRDEREFLPPNLYAIGKVIDEAGGAGNLKHFEKLGGLIHGLDEALANPKTAKRTKEELKKIFLDQERKFDKERISQDERSEFYSLSKDIIEAAPSLYAAFQSLFASLSPRESKTFINEVLPLYQAQLIVFQEMKDEDFVYNPRDLVEVRQAVKNLVEKAKSSEEGLSDLFAPEKDRLVGILKAEFKNRFGLLKVPDNLDNEGLRSIQNGVRYIGNISNRSAETETIISFYLGLEINKEWEKFRRGEDIKLEEYLEEDKLEIIKPLLEERKNSYELISEVANISEREMPEFQKVLQEDIISNMIGNIQTVDVKLENIKNNIIELNDPDIYETETEKSVVLLLSKEGKLVGATLAKTYGEVSGKKINLTPEEKEIREKLSAIFKINSWTTEDVKRIQDYIQPYGLISNMINKMTEEKVDSNISELKGRLNPSSDIIAIFNRLGEDFKQESGALALSKDLTYLENIIVKDRDKISPDEKIRLDNYLGSIKEKMKDLEIILDKVKEYFNKIKKSAHLENNNLLKNRLEEIEKIVNSKDSSGMIVSHMTKDLNLIIENMRQCLGCMRKEVNNDTNLSFGDYNKFFMMNQGEKNRGSMSDEIVFFLPAKIHSDQEEMTFVFDRVYGSKSSDVLICNIMSVYKKYKNLKKINTKANISISVSQEAMQSVGLSAELLKKRLGEMIKDKVEMTEFEGIVNVPKSAFSDNYIEFGKDNARGIGEREFAGVNIK